MSGTGSIYSPRQTKPLYRGGGYSDSWTGTIGISKASKMLYVYYKKADINPKR
jgi:hypothetical protein